MENEGTLIAINGAMIWGLIVSVGLMVLGNAIRMSSAKSLKQEETARAVEDRLLMVETKMVEEARVREIINESVKDIKEGQSEIRGDIKGLVGEVHQLAEMMAGNNINR
jgi:hypothetical protein